MKCEMQSLYDNHTSEFMKLPKGKKALENLVFLKCSMMRTLQIHDVKLDFFCKGLYSKEMF